MVDEVDLPDLRARADKYAARTRRFWRWGTLVANGFVEVLLLGTVINESVLFADPRLPTEALIIPVVGWFITFCLQALASLLHPGEGLSEEEDARVQTVSRWGIAAFISAIAIWLLTIIFSFFLWSERAWDLWSHWFILWGGWGLLTFFLMIIVDTGWMERQVRRQVMQNILVRQAMDQLDAAVFDKPKRKRQDESSLVDNDPESKAPDSANHLTNSHKR